MASTKDWDFGEKQKLQTMTESGLNIRECAYFLNRTFSSVKHQILRGGGTKNYSAKQSQDNYEKGKKRHRDKIKIPFTQEEKTRIEELRKAGKSLTHIAHAVGCGTERLKKYFESPDEEVGVERGKNLIDYARTVKERLYCLEQTLEIVLEELENLKRRK